MELFSEDEMSKLSPKLLWMKEHNINVFEIEESELEEHIGDWIACQGEIGPNNSTNTQWANEEGALLKLAGRLKLTFYR